MSVFDVVFGKPLATSAEHDEHIGVAAGIPIFGLDGLTSAAYGPEAAMQLLVPLGIAGVSAYLLPVFSCILVLLAIVYLSYRQTIEAYPNGGGSYTVASENLGDGAGLLAAAALMIDYILTAAVGISAGVTALVSASDGTRISHTMHHYQLAFCLLILIIIATVNMRGMKESGFAFMLPTFIFVGTLVTTIAWAAYQYWATGGHPVAVAPPPPPEVGVSTFTKVGLVWLLMKTFASGCAAMTGVEAVSNGVTAFREPRAKKANQTLTIIIGMLIVMLYGLSWVAKIYHVTAMNPDAHNYQNVLSIEVAAVFGRGWFYFLTMGGVLAALSFSANTAFADFPAWLAPSRCGITCRMSSFCVVAACSSRTASTR
ncbi:amino acid permease [Granulicella cerasi]|uniref:Amino acid permease n=1 Tax=Granulicella cerasi TaxID=741063 RepID=A0ABW1Z980_9BACT